MCAECRAALLAESRRLLDDPEFALSRWLKDVIPDVDDAS